MFDVRKYLSFTKLCYHAWIFAVADEYEWHHIPLPWWVLTSPILLRLNARVQCERYLQSGVCCDKKWWVNSLNGCHSYVLLSGLMDCHLLHHSIPPHCLGDFLQDLHTLFSSRHWESMKTCSHYILHYINWHTGIVSFLCSWGQLP